MAYHRITAAAALLLALASSALAWTPPIDEAARLTGLPNAVLVPGYGVGYSFGAYPPPGDLVGPGLATFDGDAGSGGVGEVDPTVSFRYPPADPSPTSIYRSTGPGGGSCVWRQTTSQAFGSRWEQACGGRP